MTITYVISGRNFSPSQLGRKLYSLTRAVKAVYDLNLVFGRLILEPKATTTPNRSSPKSHTTINTFLETIKIFILDGILLNLRLMGRLRNNKSDVIWHRASPLCITPLLMSYIKKRIFIYEWKDNLYRQTNLDFLGQFVERLNMSLSNYVFVESEVLKKKLQKKHNLSENKIFVTYNAVDTSIFTGLTQQNKNSRIRIGYIGSFAFYHNMQLIFRMISRWPENVQRKYIFVFVGDGGNREELQRDLSKFKELKCTWLGKRPMDEIPEIIASLDVCLLPGTTNIICPIKIMEYMSAGKPIVLPRHSCNLEILAENDAYYFHPDDEDSMSHAIQKIDLSKFREMVRPRLLATVEQRFTWQATYLAALEKIESLQ